MHTLIERPRGQRKYLREIKIFLFPPLYSCPNASIKNVFSITGATQIHCVMTHGCREPKINTATTFFMLSFAFIRFFLSLLFHPPKWNIQVLRELGQIGSNLQLNLGKLVIKGLTLLLKSAFSVNTIQYIKVPLMLLSYLKKPLKGISERRFSRKNAP